MAEQNAVNSAPTQAATQPQPPRRRRHWLRIVLVVLVAAGVIVFAAVEVAGRLSRAYHPPALAFAGSSTKLTSTVIVPTLDTPLPPGKNVIWCSSFQIAWNHMCSTFIKGPIQLPGNQALADSLNAALQTENDLPLGSFYIGTGKGLAGAEKIQRDLAAKFPSAPKAEFKGITPDSLIACAYLEAGVKFTRPFFVNRKPFLFHDSAGGQTAVTSFGIRPEDHDSYMPLREQVEVLFSDSTLIPFRRPDSLPPPEPEFAIDPCRDSLPSQIILAGVHPGETLAAMLENIDRKTAEYKKTQYPEPRLEASEVVLMPNLFWMISHHFSELEGLTLNGRPITEAFQWIQFRLDRSGAELKSESHIVSQGIVPRRLVFDHPFLIVMKARGTAQPYFVMWVDNAELLSK